MKPDRIIQVKIEMDLVEGEHFNPFNKKLTDDQAIEQAMDSFIDNLGSDDLKDYLQAEIISQEG